MDNVTLKTRIATLRKAVEAIGGVRQMQLTDAEIETIRAAVVTRYGGRLRSVSGNDFRAMVAEFRKEIA